MLLSLDCCILLITENWILLTSIISTITIGLLYIVDYWELDIVDFNHLFYYHWKLYIVEFYLVLSLFMAWYGLWITITSIFPFNQWPSIIAYLELFFFLIFKHWLLVIWHVFHWILKQFSDEYFIIFLLACIPLDLEFGFLMSV